MIDYHLHLWPHGEPSHGRVLGAVSDYCERASEAGVSEIALTEHLFRFRQADAIVGGFWRDYPDSPLAGEMERYWQQHQGADLDHYVEQVAQAKRAGLPVVLGLEVDYYPGRMERVARLLDGYPFDVLLGSVHWLGPWMFDDVDSASAMVEWDRRPVREAWEMYTVALEELAGTGTCDVLAHPDLIKVTGRRPAAVEHYWDRMADAASASGMAAEVSSAGWRKPVGQQYPEDGLLQRFARESVPVTTASDAHGIADVAYRSAALRRIVLAAGYDRLATFRLRTRTDVTIDVAAGDSPPGSPVGRVEEAGVPASGMATGGREPEERD
ncbi:MAG: histidinol-phosphatase [Actinomycetota bacterium]|nr:histidinol-phosphatase [Actinomycetota bacterium]